MSSPGEIDRDALIAATLPYVRTVAQNIARTLPRGVDLDELMAAGREGLVDAAQRYDPARGAVFRTFAHYRIRGAILDSVRESTANSPHYRARAAAESAVDDLITQRLDGPAPADALDAAAALASVLDDLATAYALAEIAEHTAPSTPPDPESALDRSESASQLHAALEALPERERELLRGVYYSGYSIERAGGELGVSKSWASRIHARGLSLLRERLSASAL